MRHRNLAHDGKPRPSGIGHVIQLARGLHDVPLMFSAIIVVLVLVLLAEYAMTFVENRFAKWKPPAALDTH